MSTSHHVYSYRCTIEYLMESRCGLQTPRNKDELWKSNIHVERSRQMNAILKLQGGSPHIVCFVSAIGMGFKMICLV